MSIDLITRVPFFSCLGGGRRREEDPPRGRWWPDLQHGRGAAQRDLRRSKDRKVGGSKDRQIGGSRPIQWLERKDRGGFRYPKQPAVALC